MEEIRDYVNDLTAEEIMIYVKCKNPDMYMDIAEDLLEDMNDNDVLHPVIAYEPVKVTGVDGAKVLLNGVPLTCEKLAGMVQPGQTLYAAVSTVGPEMNGYNAGLDDALDQFIMQSAMQLCLSNAEWEISKCMRQAVPGTHMEMIKPGIEGLCASDQLQQILALMPGVLEKLSVELRPDGIMIPVYTCAAVFCLTDGEPNMPETDAPTAEEIAKYSFILNTQAGHI